MTPQTHNEKVSREIANKLLKESDPTNDFKNINDILNHHFPSHEPKVEDVITKITDELYNLQFDNDGENHALAHTLIHNTIADKLQQLSTLTATNKKLSEALEPFANMDRENCNLDEIACDRGHKSDMTIITSRNFRNATTALKETEGGE